MIMRSEITEAEEDERNRKFVKSENNSPLLETSRDHLYPEPFPVDDTVPSNGQNKTGNKNCANCGKLYHPFC